MYVRLAVQELPEATFTVPGTPQDGCGSELLSMQEFAHHVIGARDASLGKPATLFYTPNGVGIDRAMLG
jgi:hypothetical protein